jgi:multiple sugar transport system substrate-binding protein
MKKSIRRLVCSFSIIVLLVSMLTACGGNKDASSSSQASDDSPSVTSSSKITFAYWGSQTEAEAIKAVVKDFEKNNPNIKVEQQWIQKDYFTKLQTMIAGDTAPDVMLMGGADLPGYAAAFTPLEVIADKFTSSDYVEALIYEGQIYAVPFIIKPKVMAINTDLFEKNGIPLPSKTEPMTPQQFEEIALKLTSGEGKTKVYGSEPLWLGNWIYALGGSYYTEDLSKSALDSPESMAAGEFMVNAKKLGYAPNDTDKQGQDMMNWFLSGRIGMYTDFGPWHIPQMADVEGFKWDLVPIPGNGGSKEANGLSLSKDSKNADAAKAFITYLTESESAQKIIGGNKNAYGIPVIANATADFEQIYPDKNVKAFTLAAEHQTFQEAPKRRNEINSEMKLIDDQTPIGSGKGEVKDVFPMVAEKINKILSRN